MRRRSSTKGRFVKEVQLMAKTMKMMIVDIFFIINPSQWSMIPSQSPVRAFKCHGSPRSQGRGGRGTQRWPTCSTVPWEMDRLHFLWLNMWWKTYRNWWWRTSEGLFFPLKNEMKWLWHGYLGLFSWKSLKSWWWIIWNLKSSFSHEKWRWHSYIIMQGMPHFQKGPFVVWTFQGKPLNLVT